jgi:hypothetical protein
VPEDPAADRQRPARCSLQPPSPQSTIACDRCSGTRAIARWRLGGCGNLLRANRAVDRGRDLFARASSDGAAKRRLPALGAHRRVLEPQVGKHRSLIDVTGDLLRAALGGDVLGARELRAATRSGKVQQITGNERHCPAGTLLPRSVGSRIHHDLTNDSPARMMRVAASNEKARERLGNGGCPRLGSVAVKMTQCGADVAPVVDRSRELHRTPPWLVC